VQLYGEKSASQAASDSLDFGINYFALFVLSCRCAKGRSAFVFAFSCSEKRVGFRMRPLSGAAPSERVEKKVREWSARAINWKSLNLIKD
jgi:hypothetical protein